MKRPIEGKVRVQTATQELSDQRNAAKAFINERALLESGIADGSLCIVESMTTGKRIEAIASISKDKNIARNVICLSRALQQTAAFELGDIIQVIDAGRPPDAETVVMREISTNDTPSPSEKDRACWSYALEGRLGQLSRSSLGSCRC
jgi:hypothetical protein